MFRGKENKRLFATERDKLKVETLMATSMHNFFESK